MEATHFFFAKTNDAFLIKVLIEILSQSLKNTALFMISAESITLRMCDARQLTLFDLCLEGEKFHTYRYHSQDKCMHVGLTLTYFSKILKTVRKKDTLNLFITKDNPMSLQIQIIPSLNDNMITTTEIKIQDVDVIEMSVPSNYDMPIIMQSVEFQKLVKNLGNLGNTETTLRLTPTHLHFISVVAGGVMKRDISFKLQEYHRQNHFFESTFAMSQLNKIDKLAAFTSHVNFYIGAPLHTPLRIHCTIGGGLGYINIYIKDHMDTTKSSLGN